MQPPRRTRIPVFSLRGDRNHAFWGIFFQILQENSFFRPGGRGLFHRETRRNHRFPRECGKLCGNCEKPLSPCGLFTFPRFHNGFRLCKRTCLFFVFRTKIAFFRPAEHPQDTGGIGHFPALSCVKWERANFFPTVCPQGFNIHFISCPGAFRPGWNTVQTQRKPYAIPRFCGILAAKPRVFRRVFTKGPQSGAGFPRRVWNVYLCDKICRTPYREVFP